MEESSRVETSRDETGQDDRDEEENTREKWEWIDQRIKPKCR